MPDHANPQDAPPAKRSRKPILIVAAALALAGAGTAAWLLARPADNASASAAGASARVRTNTVFVPLEQFTVNLADEGGERFAQVAVTLEVADAATENSIKTRMPAIRNSILMQLSSLESKELLTVSGKELLASRIIVLTARELGWQASGAKPADPRLKPVEPQRAPEKSAPDRPNPVAAVHFSHFIVQ